MMRFQGKVAIVTGGNRGMGRAIAHALAMQGATVITVKAVCPGPVVTDMLLADVPDAADRQALARKAPLGRLGQPGDVAAAVLYLASDDAGWCT